MAVFQFDTLSNGQAISFNPNADVLSFSRSFSAGDIVAIASGANTLIQIPPIVEGAGKTVTLTNVSPLQLTTTNVSFANGSLALFGDNSTATQNDNLAQSITGSSGRDLLQGFGGADTLNGGLGDDTYVADPSDLLIDSGGFDRIVTDVSWTLGADFENLFMLGTGNIGVTGNNGNNFVVGNSGNNYFNLRAGDDNIFAGAGDDWIDMSAFGTGSYGRDDVSGGAGFDTVNFAISAGQQSAINVDLSIGFIRGGGLNGAGSVTVTDVERVIGAGFNDTFKGSENADTFEGREGNDTLSGMGGNDTLIGGTGQDTFLFAANAGAANADVVTDFASATDKLTFDNSVFTAIGPAGNFVAGDARFASGAGFTSGRDASDRIIYNTTTGQLFYDADGNGAGAAQLVATLQGRPAIAATDIAVIGDNANTNQGTAGNDHVIGTEGNDSLNGLAGNDTIDAFGGDDTVDGGTGNDSLTGGVGADSMRGGDGDDTLDAASGTDHFSVGGAESPFGAGDTVEGGLGNDVYFIQENDVVVDAGGIDTILTNQVDYTLGAGFENLSFHSLSSFFDGEGVMIHYSGNGLGNVIHSAGAGPRFGSADTLDGGAGNDTLFGGGGDTTFRFALAQDDYGHDELHGNGGFNNIVDLSGARSAIVADLQAGTLTGGGVGGAGSATLDGINGVGGGAFDDRIIGSSIGVERDFSTPFGLKGGGGNDTIEGIAGTANDLFGDDGNDRLVARGNDWLDGGAGADSLVFAKSPGASTDPFASANVRTMVFNFVSGQDKIALDAGFHSNVGASGNFAAGDARFFAGAGAVAGHDADDRVVYDTSTGNLYFDADGSGAGVAQLVAGFSGAPTIVATDIAVERGTQDLLVVGGPGNDTLAGGAGSDTLDGAGGNDSLSGAGGSDSLIGGSGDDSLDGGDASDTLDGGAGNDTYFVTEGDILRDASGVDLVIANASWTLDAGFENLTLSSESLVLGRGNELDNVLRAEGSTRASLVGNDGNDTIFGGGGFRNELSGGAGNDVIRGGVGTDVIFGDTGDDFLFGDDGNDSFQMLLTTGPAGGNDTIDGGAGFDTLDYEFNSSGVVVDLGAGTAAGGGSGGADSARLTSIEGVFGTRFADRIIGDGAANMLVGRDGDNTLQGGAGNDTLQGGGGHNSFVFAATQDGPDTILGFAGSSDTLVFDNAGFTALGAGGRFTADDQRFFADAGATSGHDASDRLICNTSTGDLYYDADGSGSGEAQLIATLLDGVNEGFVRIPAASDIMVIGAAGPTQGTAGNDSLTGTEGNDSISGLAGADTLNGLGGNDTLDGGAGVDTLNGGPGNDTYIVTAGDVLTDTGGIDTVVTDVSWTLGADFENLTMTGTAGISVTGHNGANLAIGNSGNNYFNLRAGNDTIQAGAGNDWIDMSAFGTASYGDDVIDGGAGTDTVNFAIGAGQQSAITADLTAGTIRGGGVAGAGSAAVTSIEHVIGAGFNDSVKGSAAAETLEGREGNDTLSGMGGNDTLMGGTGADSFVFAAAPGAGNVDLVSDFVSGTDKAAFDNAIFTALGADGNFVAGDARFAAGAGFTSGRDASDRMVYNTSTGQLFYDADGSGAGAAQLVATFQGAPAVAATDITVI